MKRVVAVAALAVAAFVAYWMLPPDPAEAQYRRFAEAVLHRQYDEAAALCDGLTADDLSRLGTQERIGAGPAMFQTLFPSRFAVTGRRKLPDGSVVLDATQTVLFNPVGVESAVRPAMSATLRQVTTLHKTNGAWKVTAFENTFETMDATPSRNAPATPRN